MKNAAGAGAIDGCSRLLAAAGRGFKGADGGCFTGLRVIGVVGNIIQASVITLELSKRAVIDCKGQQRPKRRARRAPGSLARKHAYFPPDYLCVLSYL